MDYIEDPQNNEEGTETPSSLEDQRPRVVMESLGMLLVRSSLAGDSPCFIMGPHSTRRYYASEDYYLLNSN